MGGTGAADASGRALILVVRHLLCSSALLVAGRRETHRRRQSHVLPSSVRPSLSTWSLSHGWLCWPRTCGKRRVDVRCRVLLAGQALPAVRVRLYEHCNISADPLWTAVTGAMTQLPFCTEEWQGGDARGACVVGGATTATLTRDVLRAAGLHARRSSHASLGCDRRAYYKCLCSCSVLTKRPSHAVCAEPTTNGATTASPSPWPCKGNRHVGTVYGLHGACGELACRICC